MVVLGLTGGIATGKTTASNLLKEEGIIVLDADFYTREVQKKGEEVFRRIVAYFGEGILTSSGELNRKALGKLVFNDQEKLAVLNSFIHPEVMRRMKDDLTDYKEAGESLVVIDVPLLFEAKFDALCDYTLVVYLDANRQLKRLMARDGLSEEEALMRIHAQLSMEEKVSLGDFMIDNSGTIENMKAQLIQVIDKIRD